jgi:hypothetical protein
MLYPFNVTFLVCEPQGYGQVKGQLAHMVYTPWHIVDDVHFECGGA